MKKLYDREIGGYVLCDEETYIKIRRMRARVCIKQRRRRVCLCPRKLQWYCNGVCEGCRYKKDVEDSLSEGLPDADDLTFEDSIADGCDYEEINVGNIESKRRLCRLTEIMPQAREIGLLRLQGMSDRQISERLGIPRTTLYRMLDRVKAILEQECGKF